MSRPTSVRDEEVEEEVEGSLIMREESLRGSPLVRGVYRRPADEG